MKKFTIVLVFLFAQLSLAQIGIGNINPQSTLDISTSNATAPSNTDGILIPRIDNFPATNPTASQDGMMVFYTGAAASGKGFYYWNQTTTSWVFMSGAKRINDLVDGNSPDVTSLFLGTGAGLNDDGTGNRNIGIGQDALREVIDASNNVALGHFALKNSTVGSNTAVGSYALENNANGFRNTALGTFALRSNISGQDNVAVGEGALFFNTNNFNTAIGTSALYNNSTGVNNVGIGYFANHFNENGNNNVSIGRGAGNNNVIGSGNINIGVNAGFSELGNNKLYIENSAANENNALIYGEFDNEILRTNGELQVGNPSGTGYAFPLVDGTSGQVMTTDGAGNVTFQNVAGDGTGTDDQNLTSPTLTGTTLNLGIESGTGTSINLSSLQDGNTQNTLDEAYDEGGAGAGRVIDASDGTVTISGVDGLLVTGTANAGASFDPGGGVKMYFSPRTAAFRAGITNADEWNSSNVGLGSVAFGNSTIASGDGSFSAGGGHLNTGDYSVSFGDRNRVYAYAETAIGLFNTTEIPFDGTVSNLSDRVFSIGNGTNNVNRSNAFTVFKNGEVTINDAYTLPVNDGAANQVLTTDGSGQVNFVDASTVLTSTQNTLDEAYDEGGAGAGRTITATNGAVLINGTDGFQVTGTFYQGAFLSISGEGAKMFFYPRKAAFRAGYTSTTFWDDANIGLYSTAMGSNTTASGNYSTAFGNNARASSNYSTAFGYATLASGYYSTAFGNNISASSYSETAIGIYNNLTTANSTSTFNASDQIFSIGNGSNSSIRSNALTIYKSGLMNINDEYNMPLTDGTANQVMTTDGAGQVSFVDPNTISGNTLDQAYDEGGAGLGRTIDAIDGAVSVTGEDGFLVTGTANTGNSIDDEVTGGGMRMFFNPRTGAFRAGGVATNNSWKNADLGYQSFAGGYSTRAFGSRSTAFGLGSQANGSFSFAVGEYAIASGESAVAMGQETTASAAYSFASGSNTVASGSYSTAMGFYTNSSGTRSVSLGSSNTASGSISTAMGHFNTSPSAYETTIGSYASEYTHISSNSWDSNDRVFSIGIGYIPSSTTSIPIRQNALTIYKSGLMNINDEYDMPLTDGSANQVMTTDGSGVVTWQTPTNGDITGVTAGAGLTGGGTTGTVTLDVIATNGLTDTANDIRLGGTLTQATTITQDNHDMIFNLNGTGDFRINDNGITKLIVLDNGDTVLGGDLYMRDEDTGGSVLGRFIDVNGDDGVLDLYNSGTLSTRINGGGDSYLTGGNLGIGTTTPDYNLSVTGTLNLREDIAGAGAALRVNGTEALWFDGSLFSWGFGGTANFFADDVGIGINAPAYKLDVRDNLSTNYVAQIYNTNTGADADGLRIQLASATPGATNTFIGFLNSTGAFRGRINGSATGVNYLTTSDERLKTNISNIDNALNLIDKIQPRLYEYKANLGTQEYGFIAQELQPLYPQAVSGTPDSDVKTNPMMVDYSRLTPLLTAGIKELKKEVDTLKTENAILKAKMNQLESLEARLSALENNTKKVPEAILASKN